MNTIKFIALAFITVFTFSSCDDDDTTIPVDTHEDAYGDVILKKMSMMGTINYIPIFMAGGNTVNATGGTVTDPNGTVYNIVEFWAGPGSLTGKGTPSTTKPPMGTYTFKLKFADATHYRSGNRYRVLYNRSCQKSRRRKIYRWSK